MAGSNPSSYPKSSFVNFVLRRCLAGTFRETGQEKSPPLAAAGVLSFKLESISGRLPRTCGARVVMMPECARGGPGGHERFSVADRPARAATRRYRTECGR